MHTFKGDVGYTDVDKPTSYKEKEDVDEIEEGESANRRKYIGKRNKLQQKWGKLNISKDETGYTEDKPTSYKKKKDVDEEGDSANRRKDKGKIEKL